MHAMLYSLPQLYPLPSQFSALIVWSVLKSCMSGSSTICTDHTPCPALQRFVQTTLHALLFNNLIVQTTLHALLFNDLYRMHSMPCSSTICTECTPCPALQRFVQTTLHALLFNDLYRPHSMPALQRFVQNVLHMPYSSTICTERTPCTSEAFTGFRCTLLRLRLIAMYYGTYMTSVLIPITQLEPIRCVW